MCPGGACFQSAKSALFLFSSWSFQFPCCLQQIIHFTAAQFSISIMFSIFFYIKIHGAIYFICIAVLDNLLYHVDLFNNMAGGGRLDSWEQVY